MIIVTIDYIPGREFDVLGIAKGTVIQSRHVGKDITASLKTLVGGELTSYTEMMNEARAKATQRMAANASDMGADAIICMRYASSAVMQGAAEILAYGTAVKLK
jgi:uncharacterized protein YbjQ (UPF0145 family)